jgi:hypothetical protein
VNPDDRGLQAERTRLAWRRTVLSMTALPLLALTRAVTGGGRPVAVAGFALIIASWAAALLVGGRRSRALTGPISAGRAPAALAMLAAAAAASSVLLLRP